MKQTREQRLLKQKEWRDNNKSHIKSYSDSYRETNKDRVRASTKMWRNKIKDTPEYKSNNFARVKQWRIDNPEKYAAQKRSKAQSKATKLWFATHKEERKVWRTKYNRRPEVKARKLKKHMDKYHSDMNTRLLVCLRGRIHRLLSKTNARKSASTLTLLGCTLDFFKIYLASKFTQGMSFDNYGKWHIDHEIACRKFDLKNPEHQRACFHFPNLQPLWGAENVGKDSLLTSKLTDTEVSKMLDSQAFLARILPVPLPLAA